jgi:hypothetical protein
MQAFNKFLFLADFNVANLERFGFGDFEDLMSLEENG